MAVSNRARYLVVALAVVSLLVTYVLTPVSALDQKNCCATPAQALASGGLVADGLVLVILLCVLFLPLGLTRDAKLMLAVASVLILLTILLTPLGLESRPPARGNLYATWEGWRLATITVGSWLCYIAVMATAWRPRGGAIAAVVGSILVVVDFAVDQARLMAWTPPPDLITGLEGISTVVVLGVLFLGYRVYSESEVTEAT